MFLGLVEIVIHNFELFQILFAGHELVEGVLEGLVPHFWIVIFVFAQLVLGILQLLLERVHFHLLVLKLFDVDSLLLVHEVAFLVKNLLHSLVYPVLHLLRLDGLGLFVGHD